MPNLKYIIESLIEFIIDIHIESIKTLNEYGGFDTNDL